MTKVKSSRISVTLPEEMMDDLKYRSSLTGVSISKLIFYRLRTRKPIVLVSQDLQEQVEKLTDLVLQMEKTRTFDSEILQILKDNCEMFNSLVDTKAPCEFITIKRKKKNEITNNNRDNVNVGKV